MAGIFHPALSNLPSPGVFGPFSFQDYLKRQGLGPVKTAPSISVDEYDKLAPELRDADTMVLRLGSPKGSKGTEFALVRTAGALREFFLFNDESDATEGDLFLPTASWRQLYSFQILRLLSESSLVNLALASGLLGFALGLDKESTISAAATGQSTFTFSFLAHPTIEKELTHNARQVKIDALFVARRHGHEALFVAEAKSGKDKKSLATS